MGRPVRDVARPPRHHWADARSAGLLLRQWLQRTRCDACAVDGENPFRLDPPWHDRHRGGRRGAQPRALREGCFVARDGSAVMGIILLVGIGGTLYMALRSGRSRMWPAPS